VKKSQYEELAQDYEDAMSCLATYPERYGDVKGMQEGANRASYNWAPLDAYALGWEWHKNYAECKDETQALVELVSYLLQNSTVSVDRLLDTVKTKQCFLLSTEDVAANLLYRAMASPIDSNLSKQVIKVLQQLYPTKQSRTLQVSLWFLFIS
jgi:hypothetical protein